MRFSCFFLHRKGGPRESKMLDSWRKNKFSSKCKSTIGQTKTRIEMIRKKRNSMQKYLKNDISDLLKSGLDMNAYGRTEGLLVELNLLCCYDLLDQYCEQILSHLQEISRQRECPENCREPVGTLMFAAARLAELPELRQLRTLLNERFGNSLESDVNNVFAEKLKPAALKKDMKLRLLQDVAAEYGLKWNSKALEQTLYEQEQADVSRKNKESNAAGSSEYKEEDDAVENAKPNRKSARTKHLDPDSGHENQGIRIPNGENSRKRNGDGPSGRATSLPVELTHLSPEELTKGHTRANSCMAGTSGPNGHIHPRVVPNYEDVVARLTDLGGKSKE